MSQRLPSDGSQKGFAVGRGLLAAAETLNFSMNEPHSEGLYGSSRPLSGMGGGLEGGTGKDHDSQMPQRPSNHPSNTMKLFTSLGLSPTDLDVLAQVPEESINVDTLPHLIMQLKNRKMEASRRMAGEGRDMPDLSSNTSKRGGHEDWGDMQGDRMENAGRQLSSRGPQDDFGYGYMQSAPARGYSMLDYGSNNGSGGGRERQYSELSHDPYRGVGMGPSSASDSIFMQRRTGSPSPGKVQDFLGLMPQMFPHVCSLCDFDVRSMMEWTQHKNGIRHTENRRLLLQMYPEWDPLTPSNHGSLLSDAKPSAGLLGPAPMFSGPPRTGRTTNWGADAGPGMGTNMMHQSRAMRPKIRSRVVVAKYDRKPMSVNSLFALAKPFGTIREHLVLKTKAFLEMKTHEEAVAMVEHYQRKPAMLYGKEIHLYLSKELVVIEKAPKPDRDARTQRENDSQVVFFSNLPREHEKKMELLTVARRFGSVEKHLFLNEEAFVQMSTPEDAEMLVKYHTLHPLTVSRRNIRLNICTKYKTLTIPPGKGGQRAQDHHRRGSTSTVSRSSSRHQRASSSSSKSREEMSERAEGAKAEEGGEEAQEEEMGEEEEEAVTSVMEAEEEEEQEEEPDVALEDMLMSAKADQALALQTGEEEPAVVVGGPGPAEEGTAEDADATEKTEEGEAGAAEEPAEEEEEEEERQEEENSEMPEKMEENPDPHKTQEEDHPDKPTEEDGAGEPDFPENMDEFVTLDELAEEEDADGHESTARDSSSGSTADRGLKVVNVVGFKRGYRYLDEILALAKPFGKVVRHLVLDVRPEAFLELSSEQEARAMASFYSGNVVPSVCGKAVKIYHSNTYPTIQSGRVVYMGQIPHFKTSDASLLKIAEPFGKINRYFMNRLRNECFIEMVRGEDAEKMAQACRVNPPKFQGKRLTVYISRKYKQLKHGHRPPTPEPEEKQPPKRKHSEEDGGSPPGGAKGDKPAAKKAKEESAPKTAKEEEATGKQEEKESQEVPCETPLPPQQPEEQAPDAADSRKMETQPEAGDEEDTKAPPTGETEKPMQTEEAAVTITPQPEKKPPTPLPQEVYDPNTPAGVEFVKMGYYCRLCFLFYSSEDSAKRVHCSSQGHHDKLKKHLEKEKEKERAKAQSNGGKSSV